MNLFDNLYYSTQINHISTIRLCRLCVPLVLANYIATTKRATRLSKDRELEVSFMEEVITLRAQCDSNFGQEVLEKAASRSR